MLDVQTYRELVQDVAHEQARRSSSSFFFEGTDHLRLRSFGALAGAELALEGRFLTVEGRLQPFAFRHVPSSDRTVVTTLHGLGEGFLLNVSLRASAGAPRIGQVYCVLEVVRGLTGAIQPLAVLLEGYATDTQRLGWPGAVLRASTEGRGVLRSITGTDPAAGVEISEVVPTNARWRLIGFEATLVTDATVATRIVILDLDDGAANYWRAEAPQGQTASLTREYSAPNYATYTAATGTVIRMPLPEGPTIQGGHRLQTSTVALQAGDNWGAPQLLVEEWIED